MIEYKNVALRYTEKDVLRDVNLQIEDGEFMVLVGPSGSGKTTMLKMINRLWNQLMEIFIWMGSASKTMMSVNFVFLLVMFYRLLLFSKSNSCGKYCSHS